MLPASHTLANFWRAGSQTLNQHNTAVQQHRKRGCSVCKPAKLKVTLTLQLLHHISYVHRASTKVSRISHVVSLQLQHKLGHWWHEQETLHSCLERDIPSAPPSFLCLFLVSLQDQVQSSLRFHAGTSRFTVQWMHFFHSQTKKETRGFRWMLHLFV